MWHDNVVSIAHYACVVLCGALDITELDLPSTMKIDFPNPEDLLNFTLTIKPDEGGSFLACPICLLVNPVHRNVQGWRVQFLV
jgi:hypothetical protein